ncbi:MAG: glutamine--fructose-6-phosphate transaminase (isomerizing) [Eubacteriales bacterium]|nr:glutamine--fructose-6-phosphate transaminase (isomerizing) [Eubacteriales bacterium]MDD3864687.1 glutamine--fructose-6-phosphate transaminase (isomerizing) [Eubacteriales bacterium]MDD4445911.1 glutamine--fructose-6-phosphate transaminase (isomerizing) [Eubacteriales bacterium]
MCGVMGYIGDGNAQDIIIEGLRKLEYRGYDSAGIVMVQDGKLVVHKKKGRLANLEKELEKHPNESHIGIGHTRWATHGAPSDVNAHPHTSMSGDVALIHNGIIENYLEIKEWLQQEHGSVFQSETDTEVVAHLISVLYNGDLLDTCFRAVEKMRGAYALGILHENEPDKLIAIRKDSPLVIGLGKGSNYIASDIPALLKHTKDVLLIENNEIVVITKKSVTVYDGQRNVVERAPYHVTWDAATAEKEGYDHFMLKEIHEQPKGIRDTLVSRLDAQGNVKLDGIRLTKEDLERLDRIYIVACGTAYHAGLVGKYAIERLAKIPVEVDIASEFRYRDPFVSDRTLFIAVTQSGETLDTLAALREAKSRGARVLSVVNVVGSSIARESDDVFYTWAGPEIAVASTKAYTTQLMCLYLLAIHMGRTLGTISDEAYALYIKELTAMPDRISRILEQENAIAAIADGLHRKRDIFFIGRGLDSAVAYEGSLKLKEISYINSLAIAAGELKHGTIALIDDDVPVIALANQDALFEKMLSNIQEVKARGARVIGMAKEHNTAIEQTADQTLWIPDCEDIFTPLLSVVPLQILAYYVAKLKGFDIDKPKNLAKSVTVE